MTTIHRTPVFPPALINLFSLLFIVIAIYVGYPSVRVLLDVQMSRDWPTVQGRVMSSEVERRWASRGDGFGQEYFARIWFSYYVKDQSFVSDGLVFGQAWTPFLKEARDVVARYPSGAAVTVYYQTGNEAHAVLDPARVPMADAVRVGLCAVMLLSGVTALFSLVFKDSIG